MLVKMYIPHEVWDYFLELFEEEKIPFFKKPVPPAGSLDNLPYKIMVYSKLPNDMDYIKREKDTYDMVAKLTWRIEEFDENRIRLKVDYSLFPIYKDVKATVPLDECIHYFLCFKQCSKCEWWGDEDYYDRVKFLLLVVEWYVNGFLDRIPFIDYEKAKEFCERVLEKWYEVQVR